MSRPHLVAAIALCSASLVARPALAQEFQPLSIVPSKVTMLVGETHMFRAVGKDGRLRRNVDWSVSPESAATLTNAGEEVVVEAKEPLRRVVLTGHVPGASAVAEITINSGGALKEGSVLWSVSNLPGCKTAKIIPAVPSANGPDVYVEEECPAGTLVRAITSDGRELWRRMVSGPAASQAVETPAEAEAQPGAHLNLDSKSVCDAISPGMPKETAAHLVDDRKLRLEENQRQSDVWTLEEEGFRCTLTFDRSQGTVLKKKKTIVTE